MFRVPPIRAVSDNVLENPTWASYIRIPRMDCQNPQPPGKSSRVTSNQVYADIFMEIKQQYAKMNHYQLCLKQAKSLTHQLSIVQNPSLIPLYWLVYRDSSIGLL